MSRHSLAHPYTALSVFRDESFLQASAPLFEANEVEAIEWSFDTAWGTGPLPPHFHHILTKFAQQHRLTGHGVSYSMLSAAADDHHQRWLTQFALEVKKFPYRAISEHFGFMVTSNYHRNAPMPVVFNKKTLELGTRNLEKIAHIADDIPVGLENLAFAFGKKDVTEQGEFLDALLTPFNGFLILDLHNIFCQESNFGIPAAEIIETFPLNRVKEIHISGGSWSTHQEQRIRRDTHDHGVPEEVYAILQATLKKCPNLDMVIMEQLSTALTSPEQQAQYREDYRRMRQIVKVAYA